MTDPLPPDPFTRTAADVLADLLDLCAVIDRQQSCHRFVSTDRIRALIVSGLVDAS